MNIYDIAELAGVSIATVSRVLNDSPHVAEKTKQRVRRIMEEQDYVPSGFSRSLSLNSMKTIGLICPDVADPYMARAVAYLEHSLRNFGYDCILCCSGYAYEDRQIAVSSILQRRVDAVVLIGSGYGDDDPDSERVGYIRQAARQVPVFLINGYIRGDNICCALCDDFGASYSAVREMIRSGRRRILFLSHSHSYSTNQKRKGYQAALTEAGLETRELCVQNRLEQFCDELQQSFQPDTDGVFATVDGLAVGALKCARRRGLSVPEDLCIIGYNNSKISVCCDPELSSIDSRGDRLCQIIIDSMKLRLSGREARDRVYAKGYLIRRGTTDF